MDVCTLITYLRRLLRPRRRDATVDQPAHDVAADPTAFSIDELRPVLVPSEVLSTKLHQVRDADVASKP